MGPSDVHQLWCNRNHYDGSCPDYSTIYPKRSPTEYEMMVWNISDSKPPTKKEIQLAKVLAKLFPGYWIYPASEHPSEPIPYKLNALYDARKILEGIKNA